MAVPGMTGGESRPLVKYNAKSGKWHVDNQVLDRITLVVDLENGETGWAKFLEGSAPDFKMVPMASLVAGGAYPPRPADTDSLGRPLFKRGFRLMVKLPDQLASGGPRIREWSSTSIATVRAVDQLHTAWFTSRQDGKVPIVEAVGVKEAPGAFGSNYEPVLQIVRWVDRPKDLQPNATAQPQPTHRRAASPTSEPPEDFSSFGEE